MRKTRAVLFVIPFVLMLATSVYETGCAKSATVSHPGAVNQFDSSTYDSLRTAQAAIEQARTQVGTNPTLKTAVNKAIASYNAAEDAYVAYHKAAVLGAVPDTATLSQLLATLVGDIQAIKGAK